MAKHYFIAYQPHEALLLFSAKKEKDLCMDKGGCFTTLTIFMSVPDLHSVQHL